MRTTAALLLIILPDTINGRRGAEAQHPPASKHFALQTVSEERHDDYSPVSPAPIAAVTHLAADASPTERYAASVLTEHLHLPTTLVSRATSDARQSHVVAVGFGASSAVGVSAEQLLQTATLSDDAFCLLSHVGGVQSGSVAIGAGPNSTRGSTDVAFELLRRLGFHHLAPNETIRPACPLPIGELPWQQLNLTYSPVYESRDLENFLLGAAKGWPKCKCAHLMAAHPSVLLCGVRMAMICLLTRSLVNAQFMGQISLPHCQRASTGGEASLRLANRSYEGDTVMKPLPIQIYMEHPYRGET
jgi:hypothetical protein